MIGHERAYDFGHLVRTTGCLKRLAEQEFQPNGLQYSFARAQIKQVHVWGGLNKVVADLKEYNGVAKILAIIETLKEGSKSV